MPIPPDMWAMWTHYYGEDVMGGRGVSTDVSDCWFGYGPTTLARDNATRGRRFRSFVQCASANTLGIPQQTMKIREAYDLAQHEPEMRCKLASLSLRTHGTTFERVEDYEPAFGQDPSLHPGLQDLGWQVGHDLTEACGALDNPDLWYPGVDDGIEPVPDAHVELVIFATQRELRREIRGRPSVTLTDLPWRVQRAFAERRRLRYQQWGIGRSQWETNRWSLWDVPEDPEWLPPWVASE